MLAVCSLDEVQPETHGIDVGKEGELKAHQGREGDIVGAVDFQGSTCEPYGQRWSSSVDSELTNMMESLPSEWLSGVESEKLIFMHKKRISQP